MVRQGRFTKRPPVTQRSRYFLRRQWQNFRTMSLRRKLAFIVLPASAFLILTPLITYALLARDISDPERLMNRNNTGVQLVDSNDQVFYNTGSNKALKRLQLAEISDYTEQALISSEDKNFYEHGGVSFRGLLAALYANVMSRDATAYGGSTLTQQLVKNTLLTNEKSFFRKYQEVAMAVAVDRQYTKDEILDMYLNSVYYGEGSFGIDEAAQNYFNKSAADLSLAESAMLVGILPAPSAYSPISGDPAKAKVQQERVLRRLVEDGKITAAEKTAASGQTLTYADPKNDEFDHAPHFAEMVVSELNKKYGEEKIKRSGYKVKTTLNLEWQKQAESIVSNQIAISASAGGRNAAMVAIDPKTGEVRALVGSVDYNNPDFGTVNMATTARQPGSSFKPIYVTEAINQKLFTAGSIIRDEATDFGGYKPENYDFRFRGDITLRSGLAQSLNIPAVKVMQKLGVDEAITKAREMGITTIDPKHDYGYSLALGAAEARPIDMTNAYAAFADGGRQHDVTLINQIQNKYGEKIFTSEVNTRRVQSSAASFVISDILSDNQARSPSFGTRLNIPGRDVAVKTGSTDDNRDAWTIGFTPSLAVGVWVGNNENEVMSAGGSAMAGPIWSKSIQAFLDSSPAENFTQPSDVTKSATCTPGGSSYEEFFVAGTTPSKTCKAQAAPTNQTQNDDEEAQPAQPAVTDTDKDGVPDSRDKCPAQGGSDVDSTGCPSEDDTTTDTDRDGVVDSEDNCPNTPRNATVDGDGCPVVQTVDTDRDGVADAIDQCPNTPRNTAVDPATGCVPGRGGGDETGETPTPLAPQSGR
ncbi:MAG TPA: PBP1A family penicillin-binding protein [Candidatus Saccharimonadales bacterium]|jgi:penicillin-binding protein 1A